MPLNFNNLNFEQFLKALVAILLAVISILYVDKRVAESEYKTQIQQKDSEIKTLNEKHLEYVQTTDRKVDNLSGKVDDLKLQIQINENSKRP